MTTMNDKDRLKALDALLNARMAHTQWLSEVLYEQTPCVEEDHTQCAFGKWLIASDSLLSGVPEFVALQEPHQGLHDTYKNCKNDADLSGLRQRVREFSRMLIDRIDALEKVLNRPGGG